MGAKDIDISGVSNLSSIPWGDPRIPQLEGDDLGVVKMPPAPANEPKLAGLDGKNLDGSADEPKLAGLDGKDLDGMGDQISRLKMAQDYARGRAPEQASKTFSYAKAAGLTFEQAENVQKTNPNLGFKGDWGALVKDHPVLSQSLQDNGFAAIAQDDIPQLSGIERLFGGWDEMAWKSKLALSEDKRNQELAAIGRAQRYGKATPDMLKRGDELDAMGTEPSPHIGFVPGIVPSVVGALPGIGRAVPTAAMYGILGAIGGAVATRNEKLTFAAASTMASAGLTVGMAADSARQEQGLAYRQYIKMGAEPAVAGIAADIVGVANGGLQAIPAEKLLNILPGAMRWMNAKATNDVMRRLISTNTGRAALARFAGRASEGGLLMALISSGQELVREAGGMAAGGKEMDASGNMVPASIHGGQLLDAAAGGAQQGLGFGVGHSYLPFLQERQEAQRGAARGELYKTLGQLATDSKLRERMPDEFKAYANKIINQYGTVTEAKAPAGALSHLFQQEGLPEDFVQEKMPEVAKQLRDAKPEDEITIPMADLATHIAPMKGFPELSKDLRVADELTPREAVAVQKQVEKTLNQKVTGEQEEVGPERQVYDDVYKQLTERAGQSPEVAAQGAALWSAFAKSRGERIGQDPFEYYKARSVDIGTDFEGKPGESSLDQDSRFDPKARAEYAGLKTEQESILHDYPDGNGIPVDKINRLQDIVQRMGQLEQERGSSLFQPAYHGTPHEFDKFTLDHIGSGEGNQAYGWGLYFAEEKKIAEAYKKRLGNPVLLEDGKPIFDFKDTRKTDPVNFGIEDARRTLLNEMARHSGSFDPDKVRRDMIDESTRQIERRKKHLESEEKRVADFYNVTEPTPADRAHLQEIRNRIAIEESYVKELTRLLENESKLTMREGGQLHEVDVPEKHELLDFDKPITEQPADIQDKLRQVLKSIGKTDKDLEKWFSPNAPSTTGATLYAALEDHFSNKEQDPPEDPDPTAQVPYRYANERASKALLAAGIPGLKYLDGVSRKAGEGTHNFVIWDESAIKILKTLKQGGEGGGFRGKITFDQARSYFKITLSGKANLSTFLHESGHAFLEFFSKDAEAGHAQSAEDLGKLREWLGAKEGEELSTPQLEKFARGFEAYLMEGKAPAPGLKSAFRSFASWLKLVYKTISNLHVSLSNEVRGVMDRMLASDTEIEQARKDMGLEEIPQGDMTDAEHMAYVERFSKALEDSKDQLEKTAIREFGKIIGADRTRVKEEVTEATTLDPAHNAYEALRTGKRLDGTEVPEEVKGLKLDREAVKEAGYKGIKWSQITTAERGLDPEIAAPYFGYNTAAEMLKALNERRSRTQEIKEETDKRMAEKYPNADLASMAKQAVQAMHTGAVEKLLAEEAKMTAKYLKGIETHTLKDKTTDVRFQRELIRETARRRVEQMTALEMQPGKFERAEERAGREWKEAYGKGEFEKAYLAKLDQMMAHEMYKRVDEAKDRVDAIREYVKSFDDTSVRRRIGKAGQNYLNAIDKLTEGLEFKTQTNKTLDRRASLESYLRKLEEEGATITIPDELRSEAALKNYKQMTLEELETVHDAIKNVEHMARLKNRLFDGRERRALQETAVKAGEQIRASLGTPYAEKPGTPQNPGKLEKAREWLRESRAEKKKIEFITRELDGGKTAGMLHELLFQPFATAAGKAFDLTKRITEELVRPLRELSLKERLALDRTVDFLGTPMKMRDVISVALNMGNEGNKKKLIDGYAYRRWTEEKVTQRLGELLTSKHLDIVQHFWDTIDKLWPEIKGLSERTTGVAPPRVEATSINIGGRELKGGYYPVVYDRDRSYKAEQIAQKKGDLFENNFLMPNVSKGFTEARTKYSAPLLLSLNVIPSHVNEVVHYLTHYEAVHAVDRLTSHPEIRKAISEGLGRETYNLFRPWLQAIAHDGVVPTNLTLLDSVLRHLRVGAAVTRLGFRVTNTLMQGFNLLSSMKELGGVIDGPKYLGLGMKRFMEDVNSFRDPFGPSMKESAELRTKSKHIEQEFVANFDNYTSAFSEFGAMKDKLGHAAMSFMGLAWRTVDTITWYAAREKAFAEEHPRPADYADAVVRMSQMGEGIKDKAAILRGGEGTKFFTNMYSWYSTIYNQLSETQPRTRSSPQKVAELASRYWWMIIAPAVGMSLVKGQGPKKDKDDIGSWLKFYGEEIIQERAKTSPIGGIIAETLLSEHEARFGPWISTVLRGLKARAKLAEGHSLTEMEKRDIVQSTGIASHLPATALWNAYKFVSGVSDGKLQEPVQDLLLRSPGDFK